MNDANDPNRDIGAASGTPEAVESQALTSTYKVLGQLNADSGVGVLGQNDAESGTPIGVQGAVPNNPAGYGLATPDDARVGGVLDTTYIDTNGNDFTLGAGDTSTNHAGNIVQGHTGNAALADGAVIAGGGYDDGTTDDTNEVIGSFPTVGGGRNNRISGLEANYTTIAGGRDNRISENGDSAYATIGGGRGNTVDTDAADFATISGGQNNEATGHDSAIGGGEGNVASDVSTTVAGGHGNAATATDASVGGGVGNEARGEGATVPGGRENTASGSFSMAAGRRGKATDDGTFVWADSTYSDFGSTGADQFLVEADGGVGLGTNSPRTQLDVEGAISSSKTGASVFLSAHQNIVDHTYETVVFDTEKADHFGGYDTSTGQYTVQTPGDYHLSFVVQWRDAFSDGDFVRYRILVNGSRLAEWIKEGDGGHKSESIDRTLFDMSSGDTIEIQAYQTTDVKWPVYGDANNEATFMTIRKVG